MQFGRSERLLTEQWFFLQLSEQPYTAWSTVPLACTTRSPKEHMYSPGCVTCVLWVFSTLNHTLWWYQFGPDSEVAHTSLNRMQENSYCMCLRIQWRNAKECTDCEWHCLKKDVMSRSLGCLRYGVVWTISYLLFMYICFCSCRTLTGPTLKLINFGSAVDMSLFPVGTKFKSATDITHCAKTQSMKNWTYQVTVFH
jgi:hypothetical protein